MTSYKGECLEVNIFGKSHAPEIGVEIEGLPAGKSVDMDALLRFMARRAPGRNEYSTARREADIPEVEYGLRDGVTEGGRLRAVIRNSDRRSGDYEKLKSIPRPGHADYTASVKFGDNWDNRGGGQFSGRLTAPLCIAGGICMQLLEEIGVVVGAHASFIGGVSDTPFHPVEVDGETLERVKTGGFPTLSPEAGEEMKAAIARAKADGDSVGGIIECAVVGLPVGLGDALFGGLEGRIAKAVFGIPAVKGIEFGAGFGASQLRGSENNDPYIVENGKIRTAGNNHGGILGGISSGMPLIFRAAIKPTPSIGKAQDSVDMSSLTPVRLETGGRHDPCIVPRAVPCVEAAAAVAIYDAYLEYLKER